MTDLLAGVAVENDLRRTVRTPAARAYQMDSRHAPIARKPNLTELGGIGPVSISH